MNIEAEGGELALQNNFGDIIIIPKNQRSAALRHLANGGYAELDAMAMNLPYMEDYADDGTVIPKGETKAPSMYVPKGIYNEQEFTQLQKDYESGKYIKYGDLKDPNDKSKGTWGCLGTSCNNLNRLYSGLPTHYSDFAKIGAVNTAGKSEANTEGVDSWEYPWVVQEYNLGKVLFSYDIHKEKEDPSYKAQRLDELRKINPNTFPLGTVLSAGDALTSGYIDPKAKSFRGKDEPLYRHSIVKIGHVEGVDKDGNPVVDDIYDNLGHIERIGNSVNAIPWEEFIDRANIGAATTRNSLGDWDYKKLKGKDYKETPKPVNLASKLLKQTTGLDATELKVEKNKLYDKSIGFEDKTDEQVNRELAQKMAKKLDDLRTGKTKNLEIK